MATTGPGADTPRLRDYDWPGQTASGEDLARGMTLLRASNMNVVRLQLAMERQDRRLAMEALDGLVALDGQIRDLVGAIPAGDQALGAIARHIDDQKVAVASEKLIFAAGRMGPALAPKADPLPASARAGRPLGPAPDAPLGEPPTVDPGDIQASDYWDQLADQPESRRGRRIALVLAILFLLASGGAAALYLLGIDAPALIERLGSLAGDY